MDVAGQKLCIFSRKVFQTLYFYVKHLENFDLVTVICCYLMWLANKQAVL